MTSFLPDTTVDRRERESRITPGKPVAGYRQSFPPGNGKDHAGKREAPFASCSLQVRAPPVRFLI